MKISTLKVLAQTYLSNLNSDFRQDAREHTYRNALQEFVESLGTALGKKLAAKNELARLKGNIAPDLTIEENDIPIGWIETKDIGSALDKIVKTDQLIIYKKQLSNVILTDYLEFWWFRAGEEKLRVRLIEQRQDELYLLEENIEPAIALLESFFNAEKLTIDSPKMLAERMASSAKLIKQATFKTVQDDPDSPLNAMLADMRETLVPNLDAEEFADMYAQTIVYGLFAAWLNTDNNPEFSSELAFNSIPATSPFLKKFFTFLSTVERLETIQWLVDDLVRLYKAANLHSILQDFGKGTLQRDPVVHFYETFLAAYDRETKKDRGVFYTPEPIVSFMVRSIDKLLQSHFNKPDGISDEDAIILDPATGTGTFLYAVVSQIHETKQGAFWTEYVEKNLLPRLFGFELMMAPYAIAHLKLSLHLRELGYRPKKEQPIGVYLTNALDPGTRTKDTLGLGKFIVDEAEKAAEVKKEKKVMVVLGNPPYKGSSLNPSEITVVDSKTQKKRKEKTYIGKLIEDYKKVDGKSLGERNPKWLQDDYVKFIRIGQKRIADTGYGILAFITNNSFIDNPTFRGMRQSLMNTFDEIYILDLHGSVKKKEKAKGGSKDENVFPIQQGVSINIFVKRKQPHTAPAKIFHADLYGTRKTKYKTLSEADIQTIKWTQLSPTSPNYFFIPRSEKNIKQYERFWSVKEIFLVNSMSITAGRKEFAIAFERKTIEKRIEKFRNPSFTDRQIAEEFDLKDTRDWKLSTSRTNILKDKKWKMWFQPILCCPFDMRYTYFSENVLEMWRGNVMRNMLQENLALLTLRRSRSQGKWNFIFVTNLISEKSAVSPLDNCYHFPLYIYHKTQNGSEIDDVIYEKQSNLNPKFVQALEAAIKGKVSPEKIFYYIYAVFYSERYRTKYEEFLKSDFPRVPLPKSKAQFEVLATLGEELVAYHLLNPQKFPKLKLTLAGEGIEDESNRIIEKPFYDERNKRVYINTSIYFENVEKNVWQFQIGGYQVLHRWLSEREGRTLSLSDAETVQKIMIALRETISLMKEIDKHFH
jgi:predicted helicase